MVTSKDCINKFGMPDASMERKYLELWDIPDDINREIKTIPNKLYCNKLLKEPLEKAFRNIIDRCLQDEVKTWDGCFNVRKKRGGTTYSLHSWAIAIDINAAWNGFGKEPQMSKELVACFTDAGLDWGGIWTKKDGMHFQLKKI